MITGSCPHVQTTDSPRSSPRNLTVQVGQFHKPHSGYRPRLVLLPITLGLFERLCVEWHIFRTGQRLGLSHKAVLARLAVERCQLLPMWREEWEKWFRVECEEMGDDTFGGSVLKPQLRS